MPMQYDVIIVGGGPAGSLAGITLSNTGYKVLLIDKHTFPREKFCGGGISRRVFRRFPWIQDEVKSIPSHYVNKVSFHSPNGTEAFEERDEPIYLMIRRGDFDALLLNKCKQGGIEVLEGQKISQLTVKADSVKLQTTARESFSAKLVIGADGVYSAVAKLSGLNTGWSAERMAIDFMEETSYDHLTVADKDTMYVFYGIENSSGYGYVFPKSDHLNIGMGYLSSYFKERLHEKPQTIYQHFIEVLAQHNVVGGESQSQNMHGYFLPMGGPLSKTFSNRVMLCGDAAGFVNAFTGEGIYYAMVSGEHAAKTALKALQYNDFSEQRLGQYQANWQREIGKELSLSVKIQKEIFKRPALIDKLVKAANQNAGLCRTFADYATGELEYSELKKRLILQLTSFYVTYKFQKLLLHFFGSTKSERE